jgi:hypothetical protein
MLGSNAAQQPTTKSDRAEAVRDEDLVLTWKNLKHKIGVVTFLQFSFVPCAKIIVAGLEAGLSLSVFNGRLDASP